MPGIQREKKRCFEYTVPYMKLCNKLQLKDLTWHNPTTICMLLQFLLWLYNVCYQWSRLLPTRWYKQLMRSKKGPNNTLYMAYFASQQHRWIVSFESILYFGTICGFGPSVGGILTSEWQECNLEYKRQHIIQFSSNLESFLWKDFQSNIFSLCATGKGTIISYRHILFRHI